jgi:hypothetical protein
MPQPVTETRQEQSRRALIVCTAEHGFVGRRPGTDSRCTARRPHRRGQRRSAQRCAVLDAAGLSRHSDSGIDPACYRH